MPALHQQRAQCLLNPTDQAVLAQPHNATMDAIVRSYVTMMEYPKLSNIPIANLLEEFLLIDSLVRSPHFQKEMMRLGKPMPINTPLLSWYGLPEDLLTLIMQRAILGLESYIVGAVWHEAGMRGALTTDMNLKIRNPFSIKSGSGTAECYYHLLPTLLDSTLSLQKAQPEVWANIKNFYKNLRNPLFHGQQLETRNPLEICPSLDLIKSVYTWIAQWHEPEIRELKPHCIILKPL